MALEQTGTAILADDIGRNARAALIADEFLKMQPLPGLENRLNFWAQNLAYLFDRNPGAGKGHPNFRNISVKNVLKELNRFRATVERLEKAPSGMKAGAAERLLLMLSRLHQTTILVLANHGFLVLQERPRLSQLICTGQSKWSPELDAAIWKRAKSAARRARQAIIDGKASIHVSDGKGAPTDHRAHAAAQFLYAGILEVTGNSPTVKTDSMEDGHRAGGAFLTTMRSVFNILNIDAKVERYARQVIKENKRPRRPSTKFPT